MQQQPVIFLQLAPRPRALATKSRGESRMATQDLLPERDTGKSAPARLQEEHK